MVGKARSQEFLSKLWIVIPIYNDWDAVFQTTLVINNIDLHLKVKLVLVDDGSTDLDSKEKCIKNLSGKLPESNIEIILLDSTINTGNQIAIMRGLAYVDLNSDASDVIVVMDADGEDRPEFIPRLLSSLESEFVDAVVAKRGSRNQTVGFFLMHNIFKFSFKILTSRTIDFGNFMTFRQPLLKKILVSARRGGNSLPGLLLQVTDNIHRIKIDRGNRLFGQSRTSSDNLIIWGMEVIVPFAKQIIARILRISLLLGLFVALTGTSLFAVRIFTDLLIPGTASTILILLLIFLILLVFLCSIVVLLFSKLESFEKQFLEQNIINGTIESVTIKSRLQGN